MVAGGTGGHNLSDREIDDFIASIAAAQVGGSYWGVRPSLPKASYVLVRVRDPKSRAGILESIGKDRAILVWLDSHRDHLKPGGPVSAVYGPTDAWHLISGACEVYVDADDELALIASIAGIAIRCIGQGQFRSLSERRPDKSPLRNAFRDILASFSCVDPFTGEPISFAEAVALCGFWKELIDSNRDIGAAVGFAGWKRRTVAPLLWSGSAKVPFNWKASDPARNAVAIWKSRTPKRILAELERSGGELIEVEDGFIRSVGLGADCVPPLSIIVDRLGIYFDPRRESDLERLLRQGRFPAALLDRAERLRELIVGLGLSKYGADGTVSAAQRNDRRTILVPGQVEDDRSIICGGSEVGTNLELLRRVRANEPDAHISYKPHPDVEAGHRTGLIPDEVALDYADEIVRSRSISSLFAEVDEVHVNTSLAGFEALMRGKQVTTYGVPFYAGWGLTRDLGAVPGRRNVRRTLPELIAASLLVYPRYVDPLTGLPCPPEVLIHRLSQGSQGGRGAILVALRRVQGRVKRQLSSFRARLAS